MKYAHKFTWQETQVDGKNVFTVRYRIHPNIVLGFIENRDDDPYCKATYFVHSDMTLCRNFQSRGTGASVRRIKKAQKWLEEWIITRKTAVSLGKTEEEVAGRVANN